MIYAPNYSFEEKLNLRIVIDVNDKITELDEVVVTPENTEKFLDLKEEEFKRYDLFRWKLAWTTTKVCY